MSRKSILALILVMLLVSFSFAAEKPGGEIKRMSIFISNFTEVGLYDFDVYDDSEDDSVLHLGAPENVGELIRFGIEHNVINNPKTRIKKCEIKNCEHGAYTIDGKFVTESVRKYFDMPLENQSLLDSSPSYYYDGKLYHFDKQAETDTVYYAEVQSVSQKKGIITMKGEIYNVKNKSERPAMFTATAKPYKWDKKNTWSILSLKFDWK